MSKPCAECSERKLGRAKQLVIGGITIGLVILARARTFLAEGRFEGIDGILLGATLVGVWMLCLFVLDGRQERDRFCLVTKGIALPGGLLAGGELILQ